MKCYKGNNSIAALIFTSTSQQPGPISNRANSILSCVRMNISKRSRQVTLHLHSGMGRPHLGCCTSSSLSSTDINNSVEKKKKKTSSFGFQIKIVICCSLAETHITDFFHRGFNLDHQKPERQNQKP